MFDFFKRKKKAPEEHKPVAEQVIETQQQTEAATAADHVSDVETAGQGVAEAVTEEQGLAAARATNAIRAAT